jgi:hypothetical protein
MTKSRGTRVPLEGEVLMRQGLVLEAEQVQV